MITTMSLLISAIRLILTPVILCIVLFGGTANTALAAEQEAITLEELKQLAPFPETYDAMSYEGRLDWLNSQINKVNSPAEDYNYKRAIAFEYYSNYKNPEAQELCNSNPPLSFDVRYRYLCVMISDISYDERINDYLELYEDAVTADKKDMVAQVLVSMGWYQSGNGDIDLAFKSYEEALSLGQHLDFFTLTDVMVNTATLYIVHGDKVYVKKGIELHKETIERLKQKKEDDPDSAEYVDGSVIIAQFNIGIAYALHLHDYQKALHWFNMVSDSKTSLPHLQFSSLIFGALSAFELGREQEAQQLLSLSYDEPEVNNTEFSYLYCYREFVQYKLQQEADLRVCLPLHPNVPLEVKVDVYKRISELDDDDLSNQGQEHFYQLYVDKLENQLKQSSSSVASTAELHRQQQESRLRNELLEKEIALKTAQQERREDQIQLVIALLFILLLLVFITIIRLNQKRRLAKQYEELSVLDVLTGLKNRRFLEQNIDREMSIVRRSQGHPDAHSLGVYLLDTDHFKRVNDTYGHAAGDEVLVEFAQRINETIRDADLFVRWGGEEFLLVARLEQAEGLKTLAERLSAAVKREPYAVGENQLIDLTCTIGAVAFPCVEGNEKDISWNKLVKLADLALYYGKQKQRDCWVCIEKISAPERWDRLLAQDFEQTLRNKQIIISTSISEPHSSNF